MVVCIESNLRVRLILLRHRGSLHPPVSQLWPTCPYVSCTMTSKSPLPADLPSSQVRRVGVQEKMNTSPFGSNLETRYPYPPT